MNQTLLCAGAALGALLVATQAAQAAPAHKHKAHAKHAVAGEGLSAEVRELRAEVKALQARLDGQSASQQAQIATATAQAAAAQSTAVAAETQVQVAQAQVDALPAQVKTEVAANKPKTDKIYVKGVSITLGGFLDASSIYRSRDTANDVATSFNAIPFNNVRTAHVDNERFSARQTRLSALVAGDPAPDTHLAMYGEIDFQGAAQTANSQQSNSYNPRMRHLYGTVDWDDLGGFGLHFLAGQTWSLATQNAKGITPRNEAIPPQSDSGYVPGFVWTRQPQARITGDFLDHHLWLAASAENPQTTFYTTGIVPVPAGAAAGAAPAAAALPSSLTYNITGGGGFNSANTLSLNHIPDVVVKAAYELNVDGHQIHAEGFGLGRAFYDRRNLNVGGLGPGTSDNVYGGGVGFGLNGQIIPDVLDAQVSGLFGKGIGRYGASQLPDATFRPDGHLEPLTEEALLAGGTLHATKMLDIYGFAGEEHVDRHVYTLAGKAYGYGNPSYDNLGCDIEGSTACVGNTKLIEQATAGFWQKIYAGPFGRAQFGVQYSYTERHAYSGVGGAPNQNESILFTSFRFYPF